MGGWDGVREPRDGVGWRIPESTKDLLAREGASEGITEAVVMMYQGQRWGPWRHGTWRCTTLPVRPGS